MNTVKLENPKKSSIDRILRAAASEFQENGFSRSNIERIAESASVSSQLIFHYYKSKKDLYKDVLDFITLDAIQSLESIEDPGLSPMENFGLLVRWIFQRNSKGARRLLADQIICMDGDLYNNSKVDRIDDAIMEKMIAIFDSGALSGEFKSNLDCRCIFTAIVVMTLGQSAYPLVGSKAPFETSDTDVHVWLEFAVGLIKDAVSA